MRKSCFIKLKEKTESFYFHNKHLYVGENVKNIYHGVYRYDKYIIVFDEFFDEAKNRHLKHISVSNQNYTSLTKIDRKIRYIIKNFIGENFEVDQQLITDKVLNIYEKINKELMK